jgi:hypothetical protein
MAVTQTVRDISLSDLEQIVVDVVWGAGGDVTAEVALGGNYVVHHVDVINMYGANAGHTNEDMGIIEIDETVGADGTFEASAVTVNRLEASADGTLAAQQSRLVFYVSGPVPA